MKILNRILLVIFLTELSLLFLQSSHAFYSDTALSSSNLFTASSEFPTVSPTMTIAPEPGDVVINEIYSGGNSNEEWVELFNKSTKTIDVSGWKITDNNSTDVFPSVTPIPPNDYAVIVTDNTSLSVPSSLIKIVVDSQIGNTLNNPGDKLLFEDSVGTDYDFMSYGSNTDAFPTPPDDPVRDESLARIPNGVDTDTAADWQIDTSPTLGTANVL